VSDQFEKNLRDHLHREAEEAREFPRRLRGRIRDGIAPRARTRMAPQLALAGALVLVAIAVLAFRNPTIVNVVTTDIKSILLTPTPTPTPAPTPQPFSCTDRSAGSAGVSARLIGIRTAPHDGYDRIVFEFSGAAVPAYNLVRQESPTFYRDASGQAVTLDGNAGVKLIFHDTDAAPGVATDARPALPMVREIAQVGNFERVLSYGVGLSSSQCIRVLSLSGPRLVVDVATSAP
jgi:hypothetical protein